MGQQLSCKYCSHENNIHYCIRIEKLGDGGPALDASNHDILEECQTLFNIEFDEQSYQSPGTYVQSTQSPGTYVSTYLCCICFEKKFGLGENCEKFSFPILKNKRIYFLKIFIIKKSSLWKWLEN